MKKIFGILFFLFFVGIVSAQDIAAIEKKLNHSFHRIQYWYDAINDHKNAYDSLYAANKNFEKMLHQYGSNPQTLNHDFKTLKREGVKISTSEDGKFRIYSWDTLTGGTMHFYRYVFQYEAGKKVKAEISDTNMEDDSESLYYKVNDVVSEGKRYYLTQNHAVYSNALLYYTVKFFTIENGQLKSDAKLIKTPTGLQNELTCELDFSATVNQNNPITYEDYKNLNLRYDPKKQIISIPLVLDNSKITTRRVRYQFNGKYFEKL
ncbi:hypothetical protein [Chryseobacterium sp. Mn2064]|uniref:hypothetical protein n=1 Tax=Chryseobacterium sp. Mn2064 TaxID=3395263 RepID=UPI003BC0525A